MANPNKPDIDYSYTAFQQAQGDNSFPGTQLDNDLANLKASIDEVIDFTTGVVREDGQLANGSVKKHTLGEDVLLGVPAPRPWVTGVAYEVDQTATINNSLFICTLAHTSGTFSVDLAADRWALLIEFTVPAAILDDAVTEPKIAANAVTEPKIAANAVTTAKIADQAVSQAKLATNIGVVPIGGTLEWDGVFAPSGWLFKNGQSVSRVTYLALLNVLAPSFTATAVSGSNTLTGLSVDLRNLGLEGAKIEGAGVPSGTTVVSLTASTLVMSSGATASAASVALRVFPHGNGDGATTFNVPDDRDRVGVGRGNMGGTGSGRISSAGAGASDLDSAKLGAGGGVDRHALSSAQMPSHTHTATSVVTDPGHAHNITTREAYVAYFNGYKIEGFSCTPAIDAGAASDATASGTTGVTVATTVASTGSGAAHPNIPPSRVVNKIIFAGV